MTRLFEAKPFIVAEVGSNWHTYDDCKESIDLAAACGASAAKFQLFSGRELYGPNASPVTHELPGEWLEKLAARCKLRGIEFMCTAFSPEVVRLVNQYVNIHKVASSDLTDPLMLEAVKSTGKPVLLSTGASSWGDISIALLGHKELAWKGFPKDQAVVLYCNAAYPSTQHNLFMMDELKKLGFPVGLSDHSLDSVYCPLSAVKHFGAVVIEKHFKLRSENDTLKASMGDEFSTLGMNTPDAPHSLDPGAFKLMVDHIRGKRVTGYLPSYEENHMFLRNNRRLIATQDIAAGQVLVRGKNYGAYRSLQDDSQGFHPMFWQSLEGKAVKAAVKAGQGISPIMVG